MVDIDDLRNLEKQIDKLEVELSLHRTLIISLMSELGRHPLIDYSTFRRVSHSELDRYPDQSEERYQLNRLMNQYLNRAMAEATKDSI